MWCYSSQFKVPSAWAHLPLGKTSKDIFQISIVLELIVNDHGGMISWRQREDTDIRQRLLEDLRPKDKGEQNVSDEQCFVCYWRL